MARWVLFKDGLIIRLPDLPKGAKEDRTNFLAQEPAHVEGLSLLQYTRIKYGLADKHSPCGTIFGDKPLTPLQIMEVLNAAEARKPKIRPSRTPSDLEVTTGA